MSSEQSTMKDLKDLVTDKDAPMGKKEPEAPFAVVALTYLSILGIAVLVIAFAIWLL